MMMSKVLFILHDGGTAIIISHLHLNSAKVVFFGTKSTCLDNIPESVDSRSSYLGKSFSHIVKLARANCG